jgi:hypothetical protein
VQGRFRLPDIPGKRAVILLVAAFPAQETGAEPRRFEAGKTHRLRVVVDAEWRAVRLELAAATSEAPNITDVPEGLHLAADPGRERGGGSLAAEQ